MGNSESYAVTFPKGEVKGELLLKFLEGRRKRDGGTHRLLEFIVDTGSLTSTQLKVHTRPDEASQAVGSLPSGTHFWSGHYILGNSKMVGDEWLYIFKPLEGYVRFRYALDENFKFGDPAVTRRGCFFRHVDEGRWDNTADLSSQRYTLDFDVFERPTATKAASATACAAAPSKCQREHQEESDLPNVQKKCVDEVEDYPCSASATVASGPCEILNPSKCQREHQEESDPSDCGSLAKTRPSPNEKKKCVVEDYPCSASAAVASGPCEILNEVVHCEDYLVNVGNPNIRIALRAAPATASDEVSDVAEGDKITATAKLRVRAADGSVADWLRITAPVAGYVLFTLQQRVTPHVNSRSIRDNTVFVSPEAIVSTKEEAHEKRYFLYSGNNKTTVPILDAPSSAGRVLGELTLMNIIETTAKLTTLLANGTTVVWMRCSGLVKTNGPYGPSVVKAPGTTPHARVSGFVRFTLLPTDIPRVDARSILMNTVFVLAEIKKAASTPLVPQKQVTLSEEPHARKYVVDVGNPLIKIARHGKTRLDGGILGEISDGDIITAYSKHRVQSADGKVAEWLLLSSPVGVVLCTIPPGVAPFVNARARNENSYFKLIPEAPPLVVCQGPMPSAVFPVSECPICLWVSPDGVTYPEGTESIDRIGNGITIMYTLHCGHQFCSTCSVVLARSLPHCPVCREAMSDAERARLTEGITRPNANQRRVMSQVTSRQSRSEPAKEMVKARWHLAADGIYYVMILHKDGTEELVSNVRATDTSKVRVQPGSQLTVKGYPIDTSQGCAQQ